VYKHQFTVDLPSNCFYLRNTDPTLSANKKSNMYMPNLTSLLFLLGILPVVLSHLEYHEGFSASEFANNAVPHPEAIDVGSMYTAETVAFYEKLDITVLHEESPRVLWVEKFFTEADCDLLKDISDPKFERSTVSGFDGEDMHKLSDVRTSSGAWLSRSATDPVIQRFVDRVSRFTDIPKDHGESIQVLKYEVGQEYEPHWDYFDPAQFSQFLTNGGQRVVSVLCFLNNVTGGGETVFPKIDLKVSPKKGGAVAWYNINLKDKTLDPQSLHGGAPVKQGTKYVAVQWMRELKANY